MAVAGFIETLVELDQSEHAKAVGVRALAPCHERSIEARALQVACALSLAEAKLGEFDAATSRLHGVIEAQKQLGVSGLLVGASYEARARVAILAGDEAALGEFAGLTAREYRRSSGSPLGARHERLMDEARVAFPHRMVTLAEVDLHSAARSSIERQPTAARLVSQVLRQATTARERASFALSLLCEDRRASAGDLYLVADQGLVLAASQGDCEASLELQRSALQFLSEQLADVEHATQIESELPATLVRGRDRPTPSEGLARPVALGCAWQGSYQYVGVALLVLGGPGQRAHSAAQLASAIATTLLEAGDARACTRADLASELA